MSADGVEHRVTEQVHSAWCLLVSSTVLAVTVILTSSARSVIRWRTRESLASHCLLDWLCGLELCMCGLELGVVLDIYPYPLPALPVYSTFLWTVLGTQSFHQSLGIFSTIHFPW